MKLSLRALRWWAACCALLLLALGALWLNRRLVCAALFLRFEQARGPSWLLHYAEQPVRERPWLGPRGSRGRVYLSPEPKAAILLVHGMHAAGIAEPRLTRFARAIASSGAQVLTPEFPELMRFRVSQADVELLADAARQFAAELQRRQVSVFGVSFGGGLALRAACDAATRDAIGRVIALGAPNDLTRVSRFVLGEPVTGPAGEPVRVQPQPYAREVLGTWLLGAPLPKHPSAAERARAEAALAERAAALRALSPASCPQPIEVPVHLVHGTGDRIIPFSETLWNARDLPVREPPIVLVSPAISHADYEAPSVWQRLELIEFMAQAAR